MKTEPHHPINPIVEDNFYVEQGRTILEAKYEGLTKREYYSGLAMSGYMANMYTPHECPKKIAQYVVRVADALILALNTQ